MLCFRCEYRVEYLTNETAPRYECKQTIKSVHTCYMYTPTKPATLVCDSHSNPLRNPIPGSALFSERMSFSETNDKLKLKVSQENNKTTCFWVLDD